MDTLLNIILHPAGEAVLEFSYLLSSILFVVGLKLLSNPESARRGNLWAASGMLLAITATLILHKNVDGEGIPLLNSVIILIAITFGGSVGAVIARKVKMTAMPQLVSFFNATGGGASALVALIEFSNPENESLFVTMVGLVIGSIAFSGSLIAYGKLNNQIGDFFAGFMKYINLLMLVAIIAMVAVASTGIASPGIMKFIVYGLLVVSLLHGITIVIPIGGADMPVVISLLNSFTGIAAAMAGFIYNNQAMILGGILVGSAGIILTYLMCRAMNRSLVNVFIGNFGSAGAGTERDAGFIKEISISDAAVLLSYSKKVIIVPGYGLAVAHAQNICGELEGLLQDKGVEVKYAIHPVAGRMPGHMNVLLAEADVPYEKLVEMEEINPLIPNTDVVIVIGANDVVNPAAIDDPSSPIYGMPIIKAHEARNIIVMKRGMGKGYAAIENNLFYRDNTRMLFGDAKDTLQKLVTEVKDL